METTKPWWASKTIWAGLATAIMAVLTAGGILPEFITENLIDTVLTAVLGVLTIVFRGTATQEIAPVLTPIADDSDSAGA